MPFPESPRMIYGKNPLEEVICQLRFPTILRINAEAPAAFQEQVRQAYPLFKEKSMLEGIGIEGLPSDIAKLISAELPLRTGRSAYEFASAEEAWTASLTKDFLALSTHKYERWEGFKQRLEELLNAFMKVYSPSFFSRIGLRYRDVIRRSSLGLENVAWSELLSSHVAGGLSSPHVSDAIEHTAHEMVIRLSDDRSRVRLKHGLARDAGANETCYVIDADFFLEQKTEIKDAIGTLDFLNRKAAQLFRWCITNRLHEAMGPRPI